MSRENRPVPRRTRTSFYLIALLLPIVIFAILELIFRLTLVGAREPLFVPAAVEGYLQPNDSVIYRFFASPGAAPNVSIDTTYFLEEKPDDGLRIVIQGGSTAAGFPYGRMASPTGMLEQRLRRAFPSRTVEVISTAMSAVNSYTVLDFADEIIAIEPDAVVIYVGHNEFLGVLGVGSAYSSSLSPQATRRILALRKLHVVEAAFQVYGAAMPTTQRRSGTLMSRIARERSISQNSELYIQGHLQFRENLGLLLAKYRRADIPVFVGTLASNEKDQPPFISAEPPNAEARAWDKLRAELQVALEEGDTGKAVQLSGQMVGLAPDSADSWFYQGRAGLKSRRYSEARHAFLKAKDLDQLRFRAPESFNGIVRDVTVQQRAAVVDTQTAIANLSDNGIIGNESMLEHLHPNTEGYFALASIFYDAVVASGALGKPEFDADEATARREMPVTEIERLNGEWRVARLLRDWPFVDEKQPFSPPEPSNEVERIARDWYDGRISWPEAMNRALGYYSSIGNIEETIRVAANLATAFPFEPNPSYVTGSAILNDGDGQRALPFLYRAVELDPRNTRYLMSLAQAFYANQRLRDSLAVLERVMAVDPSHPTAPDFADKLKSELESGA